MSTGENRSGTELLPTTAANTLCEKGNCDETVADVPDSKDRLAARSPYGM